ncbi:MAG: hypothetical protein ABT940_06390 [Alphaproteobacteria bacterium]
MGVRLGPFHWLVLALVVLLILARPQVNLAQAGGGDAPTAANSAYPRGYAVFQYANIVAIAARGRLVVHVDHVDTDASVGGMVITATAAQRTWSLVEQVQGIYVAENFPASVGEVRLAFTVDGTRGEVPIRLGLRRADGSDVPLSEARSGWGGLSSTAGIVLLLAGGGFLLWRRWREGRVVSSGVVASPERTAQGSVAGPRTVPETGSNGEGAFSPSDEAGASPPVLPPESAAGVDFLPEISLDLPPVPKASRKRHRSTDTTEGG